MNSWTKLYKSYAELAFLNTFLLKKNVLSNFGSKDFKNVRKYNDWSKFGQWYKYGDRIVWSRGMSLGRHNEALKHLDPMRNLSLSQIYLRVKKPQIT